MAKRKDTSDQSLQLDFFGQLIEPGGPAYEGESRVVVSPRVTGGDQGELFGDGLGYEPLERGPDVFGPSDSESEVLGDSEPDAEADALGDRASEELVLDPIEEIPGPGDEPERSPGVTWPVLTLPLAKPQLALEYRGNGHERSAALSPKGKFQANLEALRVLKQIEGEERWATEQEQEVLALYTGWGGLSSVFKEDSPDGAALAQILTDGEFRQARASCTTAFYTEKQVAGFMWSALEKMGAKGSFRALEPAMGSGVFLATNPFDSVRFDGIELDGVSARISAQLYQASRVLNSGFEDMKIAKSGYDLAISNVPFSEVSPYEPREVRTPGLDGRYALHDFFFLKTLHGVRDGGIVAFITSRYTMDKVSTDVRTKIAEQADVVAAFRLPDIAFKASAGTQVVTDIIFLQKRARSQQMSDTTRGWIDTHEIDVEGVTFPVNGYYLEHPDHVLGEVSKTGTMYASESYTVTQKSLQMFHADLEVALLNVPSGVWIDKAASIDIDLAPNGLALYEFFSGPDGQVYRNGLGGQIEMVNLEPGSRESRRLVGLIGIRNQVRLVFDSLRTNEDGLYYEQQAKLGQLYDRFVGEFGPVNKAQNLKAFLNDPGQAMVLALEIWDEKAQTAQKAAVFERPFVVVPPPARPETIEDAYLVSLATTGRMDYEYMASSLGLSAIEVQEKLLATAQVFSDPSNPEHLILRDEYLSGNVRVKLKEAKAASIINPRFTDNVVALEAVQPEIVPYTDIVIAMNSPVMEPSDVKAFLEESLGTKVFSAFRTNSTGSWEVNMSREYPVVWGTPDLSAGEIVHRMLNGQAMDIWYRDRESNSMVLNEDATDLAEEKADKIRELFEGWIWADEKRRTEIEDRYNERFNATVTREFVHPLRILNPESEIRPFGSQFPHPLRAHQADVIWRGLQIPNSLIAHAVGAGKTQEMIVIGMEARRLGISAKPWYVVPDHLIGQWATEFRTSYPHAKLLIANDMNWDPINRRTFINSAAYGDWDAVVIRQHAFEMIPMSPERQSAYMKKMIDKYREELEEIRVNAPSSKRSIKGLEKRIERYQNVLKEIADTPKEEGVLYFEDMGVDHLFVDEFDMYKNLAYTTTMENVRGLNKPEGSQRAFDMYLKIQLLQERGGRVVGATGTAISNSLVEAYIIQKYLQPEYLKETRLEAFDNWCRQYAEASVSMELNNTGTGYKPVTRLAKFVNVPELIAVLREVWDIKTSQDLEEMGILVPGKQLPLKEVFNVTVKASVLQVSYQQELERRERELSPKTRHLDNTLKIIGDGRKAAVDLRLINPNLPDDPNSKMNRVAMDTFQAWKDGQQGRWTQAIFFDFPCAYEKVRSGEKDRRVLRFDGVKEITYKLVELGVPKSEIFDMRDCKNNDHKEQMQKKVNEGDVRIVFGSTGNMGAGTNIQRRLEWIRHVDVPYRPRDIEQQNGRGYRQGNLSPTVKIANYATQGSLDTGLWSLLETKDRMIRSVMQAKGKDRVLEEDYYASIKELSIDDEVIKESVELDHQMKILVRQQSAFAYDRSRAQRLLAAIPQRIEAMERNISQIQADIAKVDHGLKGDDFHMTVRGHHYTIREKAGFEIIAAAIRVSDRKNAGATAPSEEIGSFAGFTMHVTGATREVGALATLTIGTQSPSDCGTSIRKESDPVGIINAFYGRITALKGEVSWRQRTIEEDRNAIPMLEQQVAREFAGAEKMAALDARFEEVMKILSERPPLDRAKFAFPWKELHTYDPTEVQAMGRQMLEHGTLEGYWTDPEATEQTEEQVPDSIPETPKASGNYENRDFKGDTFAQKWHETMGTNVPDLLLARMQLAGVDWETHKKQLTELLEGVSRYHLKVDLQRPMTGPAVLNLGFGELSEDKRHVYEVFNYVTSDGADPLGVSQRPVMTVTEGTEPQDLRTVWKRTEQGYESVHSGRLADMIAWTEGQLAVRATIKHIEGMAVEVERETQDAHEHGY